ncbi:MAG: hypothetical protein Q9N34_01640 [Aquificota bacterium]|nr:hypothetical protein [Aquificota bacterium]
MIFLEDFVEDSEFLYPYLRFKEEGFEVISVAPERRYYTGKKGMAFKHRTRRSGKFWERSSTVSSYPVGTHPTG